MIGLGSPKLGSQFVRTTRNGVIYLVNKLFWSTGDLKITWKTVADPGWIMLGDGTIGSPSSGATFASNAAWPLFKLIWTNVSETDAPLSSGSRGASALADWNAGYKLSTPVVLGRALGVAGSGSGLTSYSLGDKAGANTHTQAVGELVPHTHNVAAFNNAANQSLYLGGYFSLAIITTDTGTGGGGPMNIMQPTSFFNLMVKL